MLLTLNKPTLKLIIKTNIEKIQVVPLKKKKIVSLNLHRSATENIVNTVTFP